MDKSTEIKIVGIDDIKPDINQPRKTWNEEELVAHGHSFKVHGIINPIEVDENYVIITGESRWRSARAVGIKEIPVLIVKGLDVRQRFYRQTAENMARTPLTPLEQLEAVEKVWLDVANEEKDRTEPNPKAGGSQPSDKHYSEVARRLGITEKWVRTLVDKVANAHPEIRKLFKEGKIQATAVREIRKINNPDIELRLARKASEESFTRDDVDTLAKNIVKYPHKTDELLKESYPKKHDEFIVFVDNIVNGTKQRVVSDKEKTRSKAQDIASCGTKMLDLMGSIDLDSLEPHTLAMLYNATVNLPKFIHAFNQKIKAMIPKELGPEKKLSLSEAQAIVDATVEVIREPEL